jgi:hypothetical protein
MYLRLNRQVGLRTRSRSKAGTGSYQARHHFVSASSKKSGRTCAFICSLCHAATPGVGTISRLDSRPALVWRTRARLQLMMGRQPRIEGALHSTSGNKLQQWWTSISMGWQEVQDDRSVLDVQYPHSAINKELPNCYTG